MPRSRERETRPTGAVEKCANDRKKGIGTYGTVCLASRLRMAGREGAGTGVVCGVVSVCVVLLGEGKVYKSGIMLLMTCRLPQNCARCNSRRRSNSLGEDRKR